MGSLQHYPNNSKRFNNTLSTKTKLRPVLSDDQLAELNIRLHEALQYAQPVEVKFYNNGFVDSVQQPFIVLMLLIMKLMVMFTISNNVKNFYL